MKTQGESKRPNGRIPNHVKAWLEANGQELWFAVVCDKCGGWVSHIDHLAPYHVEANWCEKCDGNWD